MDETTLRQANETYLHYLQAIEKNAPAAEQIRLLEQWHFLYWRATLKAEIALAR